MIDALFPNNLVWLLTQLKKDEYIATLIYQYVFIFFHFPKTRNYFLKTRIKTRNKEKKNQKIG